MILTGAAIASAWETGVVILDPFEPTALNPNSYNFRLGDTIIEISDATSPAIHQEVAIPPDGLSSGLAAFISLARSRGSAAANTP